MTLLSFTSHHPCKWKSPSLHLHRRRKALTRFRVDTNALERMQGRTKPHSRVQGITVFGGHRADVNEAQRGAVDGEGRPRCVSDVQPRNAKKRSEAPPECANAQMARSPSAGRCCIAEGRLMWQQGAGDEAGRGNVIRGKLGQEEHLAHRANIS